MRGQALAEPVLRLRAPAKLNLFLHVVGRRPDGYHLLQSVFALIDWCDDIAISASDHARITRTGGLPGLPPDQDLVVRAARLLQREAGCSQGAQIHVTKHLPAGAGLGGGSSDAAAVLLGLNALWKLGLTRDALAALGAQLGADVPFFVHGSNAWVEGIGEQITPLVLDPAWFCVIVPPVHVATADIFGAPGLTRNHPITKIAALEQPASAKSVACFGVNHCEPVARQQFRQVAEVFEKMQEFDPVRLSGTGSAVFIPVDSEAEAKAVAQRATGLGTVNVCKLLQRSPVHEALQ